MAKTSNSRTTAPPYRRLCKEVRRRLIEDIIRKHKMVREKGKKKEEEEEAAKRRKRKKPAEGQQRQKKGGKKKIVSSKVRKKSSAKVSACPECGDFHFKKGDRCRIRDLRVKMIVQQILRNSDNIKVGTLSCPGSSVF